MDPQAQGMREVSVLMYDFSAPSPLADVLATVDMKACAKLGARDSSLLRTTVFSRSEQRVIASFCRTSPLSSGSWNSLCLACAGRRR